ncbi:MAG: DUF547 domain-containing protein, partial [Burkholderiaceae bacterium]
MLRVSHLIARDAQQPLWHRLPGLRLALAALFLTVLSACSTVVRVGGPPEQPLPIAQAEQGYTRVLQAHVNTQGEVNFAALRADNSASGLRALERYVQAIANTPLNVAPTPQARLAHMINAYNALSMYNVIASGIPASHAGFAKVQFFLLRKFDIAGEPTSLYAFENDTIRKLGEPRIHFALNCSAVSCPVLPRMPFTADNLEQELERETRSFFSKESNLRIDHIKRTVWFNEILKFYTEDFVPSPAPNLIAYAQRYSAQPIPTDYQVAFTPYDWTVANSQRK